MSETITETTTPEVESYPTPTDVLKEEITIVEPPSVSKPRYGPKKITIALIIVLIVLMIISLFLDTGIIKDMIIVLKIGAFIGAAFYGYKWYKR